MNAPIDHQGRSEEAPIPPWRRAHTTRHEPRFADAPSIEKPALVGDTAGDAAIKLRSWRSLDPVPVPDPRLLIQPTPRKRSSLLKLSFYLWAAAVVCYGVVEMTLANGERPTAHSAGIISAMVPQLAAMQRTAQPATARLVIEDRQAFVNEPRPASATRAARLDPNDVVLPAAAPAKLSPERSARFVRRGVAFLKDGDIAAARLMLRLPADAGDAQAALLLGATYDPAILAEIGVFGLRPDRSAARAWYQRAKDFGSPEATRRIERLAQTNQ